MNKQEILTTGYTAYNRAAPRTAPGAQQQPVRTQPSIHRMTVRQMMDRFDYLPPQTAILGVCDDGLPVLLDLADERPGPLLVIGDTASGKTSLLRGMLHTAVAMNSPYEVKYSLISAKPDEWDDFNTRGKDGHCFAFNGNYEEGAGQAVMRLAEIAEQRRTGREQGAAILLVIDDLKFMAKADYDVRLNFEWLLKNGPSQQIWPVVSISTQSALEMSRMVTYFRTRLIGSMPEDNSHRLGLYDGLKTNSLEAGKQFAVRVEDQWMNFWLPVRE